MITLDGYTILEQIHESQKSLLLRAVRQHDKLPVVIKVLKSSLAAPTDIARFKQEYRIISAMDCKGVIRTHELRYQGSEVVLVLEDFAGTSLDKLHKKDKVSVSLFLQIAVQLAETLGYIHRMGIIHKDIKPANILLNRDTGEVKITDFGISAELTHEQKEIYRPEVIEGTLAYLSPEQSGRMNCFVDYRTDFYSLGITFYEMLIGTPPFHSADPLELIHSHIALRPVPPAEIDREVPVVLSDIIMKLLSKTAEERYQSAYGLEDDLINCLRQWETVGAIEPFKLATSDIAPRFIIPQRLFGRDTEVQCLLESFDEVRRGQSRMLLVRGLPGIGKSALIYEVHKPVLAGRGYFLSGKYDQFRRDVPYSCIIQALQGMVAQILAQDQTRIDDWKSSLSEALGVSGRVITDVIPRMELIIGKQPEVPALGPMESQNRFSMVFKKFIGVLAASDHPLVMFLDDLQWADAASLRLINEMMTDPDIGYLFLIGAYRDNEVEKSHLLSRTLDDIARSGAALQTITLGPLSLEAINQMVANFMCCTLDDSLEISALILDKTGGNPFFFNQFMKTLYEEKLIEQAPRSGAGSGRRGWKWDTERIARMQFTDNVVELLAGKITRLPADVIDLLKTCAVIGNRFDLTMLSSITGKSIDETLAVLSLAIDEGLVNYDDGLYYFQHDRIQQASYTLIDAGQRGGLHYRIGRIVQAETKREDLTGKILFIVDHLNQGRGEISSSAELVELAELNLQAAGKARAAAAYESTLCYLQTGIELLAVLPREDSSGFANFWDQHYELSLALHRGAAEAAYLCTRYEEMERYADEVISHARDVLDRVDVDVVRISTLIAQWKLVEAIDTGIRALRLLGIRLNPRPGKLHVGMAILQAKLALLGKSQDDMIQLPEMTDHETQAALRIMNSMATAAYFVNPNLVPLLAIKILLLSLKYGNAPESVMSFAAYGLVLSIIGQIDKGIQFGMTAMALLEKMGLKKGSTAPLIIINIFLRSWREPISALKLLIEKTYLNGLEVGEFEMAANSILPYLYLCFVHDINLHELEQEAARLMQTVTTMKQTKQLGFIKFLHQAMLNLSGSGQHDMLLTGDSFNEEQMLPVILATHDKQNISVFYFIKFQLCFLFHDYEKAFVYTQLAEKDIDVLAGIYQYYSFFFWDAIIRIALYEIQPEKYRRIIKRVPRNLRMLKIWAGHAPQHYENKYCLVKAEYARIRGREREAMDYYDQAIAISRKCGYLSDLALANELTAKFWLGRGKEHIAAIYMVNAYGNYRTWGAERKAEDLKQRYPALLIMGQDKPVVAESDDSVTINASLAIDVISAIKASQAIASEIVLERLIEKMLMILIENAGAEKGFLILAAEGTLTVEARGAIGAGVEVVPSIPVQDSEELSAAIVHYVARTGESVLLPDACVDNTFSTDAYIRQKLPRSVLCIPITNQGRLSAVLYLENNQTVNAFPPERVRLLEMLSSQAALSIENARLVVHREKEAKLSTEMKIAANIQTALLPETPDIPGFEITAYIQPADDVGGDYYDIINAGGRNWVIIGDVSGHGVPAGLIMMMVQTSIQVVVRRFPEITPSELLAMINEAIRYNVGKMKEQKYMTITAFSFAPDGSAVYSGLHQNLIVYRATSDTAESISTSGIWLSPWDMGRENVDSELSLERGDILLLYTDGVTEARNDRGEMFSEKPLLEIMVKNGRRRTEDIKNAILSGLVGFESGDDVTIVILKRL